MGEIREQCAQSAADPEVIISSSLKSPNTNKTPRFALIPHKANYVLPVTYNSNPKGGALDVCDDELDNEEITFQFSVMVPVATDISRFDADIYFAYTQLSLWQAYNSEVSLTFRETNYEPEIFITAKNDLALLGFTDTHNSFGLLHQSNG